MLQYHHKKKDKKESIIIIQIETTQLVKPTTHTKTPEQRQTQIERAWLGLAWLKLSGEDWREIVRLGTKNPSLGVREELDTGKLGDIAVAVDADGVAEQVAGEIMLDSLAGVEVPILVGNLVDFADALLALWLEEQLVQHAQVLVPQRHSEAVHLPARWLAV